MAREAMGVPLSECLVVGDRLNTDLAFGERAGMTTVLVRTGVTDDRRLAESDLDPDYVLDSLADIDAVLDG
jgi:4-nitrophenyl phosphatase